MTINLTNKFILSDNAIKRNFSSFWSYIKVKYCNANTKVIITCPEHGDFEQTPAAHLLMKHGCPICFNLKRKLNAPSWQKDKWAKFAETSLNFDSFKLYLIECYDDQERFIKVGRTFNKIEKRLKQIPYNINIKKIITSNSAEYIFNLEYRFKQVFKKNKYTPLKDFGGKNECFNKNKFG